MSYKSNIDISQIQNRARQLNVLNNHMLIKKFNSKCKNDESIPKLVIYPVN